ncbi:Hypothetical protein D9617_8g050860 [Elsinoe fawcettii]|nr:Hypothetical protein D9617_8g050860 [Elsinoe fawcettii]
MKHNAPISAISLATCLPFSLALVGHNWAFSDFPSSGLNDITFPFSIAAADKDRGFYFAQQYNFINVDSVGYCGLQPRASPSSGDVLHAAFSSFQTGATSGHDNCSDGADGGSGVSCAVDVTGVNYDHPWNITIARSRDNHTWKGTLVDTVTGKETVIGEYSLPAGTGGIKNGQMGFVEYYPWNGKSPKPACSTLPKTGVTFFNPTSEAKGASVGANKKPYTYGYCGDDAGFSVEQVKNGWEVQVGF